MEKERNPPQKQAKAEREKPLLAPHKNQIWFKIFLLNHCGHSEIPKYIYKDSKIYMCVNIVTGGKGTNGSFVTAWTPWLRRYMEFY